MNEDTKNKARREPEADQIADRSLGKIEESSRLIPVHAEYWQTLLAIATATVGKSGYYSARPSLPSSLCMLLEFLLDRESGGKSVGSRQIVQDPVPRDLAFLWK